MELINFIVASFVGAFALQQIAFVASVRLRRVDVVDIAWGLSFIAGYFAMQIYEPKRSAAVILIGLILLAWGLRLSWHIYRRFKRTKTQDERYTKLMSAWPKDNRVARSYVSIFVVQATLATIVGLPIVAIYVYEPNIGGLVVAGAIIWLIGYVIEVVADRQLKKFLTSESKSGDVMKTGLWRYSRHPNYFGEVTMWWGISVIGLSTPAWWLGVIGAATITWFICFVSGVTLAEARMSRRSDWLEYKRKTSVFIIWFPKY